MNQPDLMEHIRKMVKLPAAKPGRETYLTRTEATYLYGFLKALVARKVLMVDEEVTDG